MSDGEKSLKERLARFTDLEAFAAKRVGKERREALRLRRRFAMKRADAAIRFFMKDENFALLLRRRDEAAQQRNTIPDEPKDMPHERPRTN